MKALLEKATLDLVRKHNLAVESLTEQQLADAIRQAVAAGDFQRMVLRDERQQVVYIPGRELERVNAAYNELLYAVARAFPGETRHETALRYIRGAENDAPDSGPCQVS